MKSVMPPQKAFSQAPAIGNIQRSVFNRSHGHKTTFNAGELVPFYVDEILPGDSQDVKANIFARLSSPLDRPIMDNLHLDTFFFFVPFRILWTNWKKFMGERIDPDDSIDFTIPQVTSTGVAVGSLLDFLGFPAKAGLAVSGSSLYARGYVKIYNEWFRDENIQDSLPEYTGDGPETDAAYPLVLRGKRHDYFTSCLPYPQKGDSEVAIGFADTAPVYGDGNALGLTDNYGDNKQFGLYWNGADLDAAFDFYNQPTGTLDSPPGGPFPDTDRAMGVVETGASGLQADLSAATAVTINDLRLAVATQQFLELNARGGTRYVELIKANFGVTSPDYRLQRPEYLGGGSSLININPVTQTGATDAGNSLYQGNQAAHVSGSCRNGYSKSFTEHGMVIGLVNVRADLTYQQGMPKMFSREDRLDFYFPTFANLGEQAVLNGEIFFQNAAADDLVFGYQERWAEYRFCPSRISGKFRSDASGTLDAWHLSQDFASLPVLNTSFMVDNPPLERVMTVTTEPEVLFDSYIEIKHARPMPVYSIPGLGRL